MYYAGKTGVDPYEALALAMTESTLGTDHKKDKYTTPFNALGTDDYTLSPVLGNKLNKAIPTTKMGRTLLGNKQEYGLLGNRNVGAFTRDINYSTNNGREAELFYGNLSPVEWSMYKLKDGTYNRGQKGRAATIAKNKNLMMNTADIKKYLQDYGNAIYQKGAAERENGIKRLSNEEIKNYIDNNNAIIKYSDSRYLNDDGEYEFPVYKTAPDINIEEQPNPNIFNVDYNIANDMTNRRTLKNGGSLYASPVEESANRIENLPIYLRRVARLGDSFTTNQQSNSMRQNANKRAKFWDGGDTSNLIAGLSSLAGSAIQGIAYSKMKSPTMPRLYRPQSFKLNYNVAPQLAEVERARQLSTDYTRRNTVSSATATDRVNTINMNAVTEANKLWQTKENKETEMFNENAKEMNTYGAKNVDAMNSYYNSLTEFNNNKIAGIASSINSGLSAIGNFATKYAENRETQNSNTINLMSSLMAANPETVSYALGNDEFRKALAKSANINVNALTQLLVDINRKKGNSPTIDTTTITSPSESQETPTSITGTSTSITGTPMTTRWLNYKSRILRKPNTSINTSSNDSALNLLSYPRNYSLLYTPYLIG
jgi:hypothetical protein